MECQGHLEGLWPPTPKYIFPFWNQHIQNESYYENADKKDFILYFWYVYT